MAYGHKRTDNPIKVPVNSDKLDVVGGAKEPNYLIRYWLAHPIPASTTQPTSEASQPERHVYGPREEAEQVAIELVREGVALPHTISLYKRVEAKVEVIVQDEAHGVEGSSR